MFLRVQKVTRLAADTNAYELADPSGEALPEVEAGAHIDLRLGNDMVRQYSLCGDPNDRTKYVVSIFREINGRGGSRYVHDRLKAGDLVETSLPRNNFPLLPAKGYILLAGGIGITPMIPMLHELRRREADFRLYYCTRSPERTVFLEEIRSLCSGEEVLIHHDEGNPERGLDFNSLLLECRDQCHLYYCGPPGFMSAVQQASAHWPASQVHCEYFSAPERPAEQAEVNQPFRIRISSTGAEYHVPGNESIIGVLRRHGVDVQTSCEDGYCGTCMTRFVSGEPDHRDTVLDADNRKRYLLICCSRSKTPVLELDL